MHKVWRKLIISSVMLGLTLSTPLSPSMVLAATALTSAPDPSLALRLGGFDQYETAAKIAEQGWPQAVNNVVLAAGMTPNLVDALAAGPLATKLNAPILLTDAGDHLNSWAKSEIQRLNPSKVYITSGAAVIKATVLDELSSMGINLVQLGGYDQYETSVNIAKEMMTQGTTVTRLVLTAGWLAPADALSISPIAATQGIPILATTQGQLPPKVQAFIEGLQGITDSYIIGGTSVVGAAVGNQLPGVVHRYSGITKYDTNLEVLKTFKTSLHYDKVYLANGETFVDALAGVPLAAQTSSPIVLTNGVLPAATKDFIKANLPLDIVALGGVSVVPNQDLSLIGAVTPPSGGVVLPPVGGEVKVSNLQIITNPTNSLGMFDDGATIDLNALPGETKVMGFSLMANQSCTVQFNVHNSVQNILLVGGQPKLITINELILGEQIPGDLVDNGVSLNDLRLFYSSKTVIAQLIKDEKTVGTVTFNLKFK